MDIKHLLIDASHEIIQLRRRNEILAAKVEMVELLASFHRTMPFTQSVAMSPDIVHALAREVDRLEKVEQVEVPNIGS